MSQPTLALTFTQDADNIAIGVVDDTTADYGTGSVETRDEKANFLLWSKTDKDGNRTFDNPSTGNELSILQWSVNTPKDGYYEGILLRVPLYNYSEAYVIEQSSGGVISQYASVFYYATTDKVYKTIQANTGQVPTDTDYFEEVTDLSTLITNTNVQIKIVDFYVRTRASRCATILVGRLNDTTCPNPSTKDRDKAYYVDHQIAAADAAFAQGNPRAMEKIIRDIENKCTSVS